METDPERDRNREIYKERERLGERSRNISVDTERGVKSERAWQTYRERQREGGRETDRDRQTYSLYSESE